MKKIRNKILISIISCVLFSSLIVGIVSVLESYIMIKEELGKKIQAISEFNKNRIDNIIVSVETISSNLEANILAISNLDKLNINSEKYEELSNILKEISKENEHFTKMSILFNTDVVNVNEISYGSNSKIVNTKKIELKDINLRKKVWSKPYIKYIYKDIEYEIITYTKPIYKEDVLIGAISIEINSNIFKSIVNEININKTGYAFLLNDKFYYISHKTLKGSDRLTNIENGKYKYIADEISKKNSGVLYCYFEGENRILGYSNLANGWIIINSVSVSEALKGIKYLSILNSIIIIFSVFVSYRVAMYLSKKISQPVIEATNFAKELANWNLDEKLDIRSDDETAVLSRSLNKAAQNINTLVNELKYTHDELSDQFEELKKSEKKVSTLAYINDITQLPNRNYLIKEIPNILSNLNNNTGALIYVDIDNFRLINDTLGHTTGDKFLKKISKHFKCFLKEKDILGHIGEDAFIFFVSSAKSHEEVNQFAESILELFKQPINMENNKKFYITSSIGIAIYPNHGKDLEALLRSADTALNKAKSSGKNRFEVFSDEMNLTILKKIEIENKLRQAIENKEFIVYYQPKIDTQTGEMMAMESLVRWISPTLGFVSPNDFIPLAEETGLIIPIGEYVLRESCRQNKIWQEKGFKHLRVAVNLSAKQLQQKNLVEVVKNVLEETGLEAKYLELEITESVLMNNFDSSINVLNKIKDIGINIYLDDFGTGYSSLNYLRKLPINSIKIDKSFVDGLTENEKDSFIASSLINLAHGIDLSVVAEGVESEDQFNLLKNYGCDEIQGYYFSKPLSANDFEKLLKK